MQVGMGATVMTGTALVSEIKETGAQTGSTAAMVRAVFQGCAIRLCNYRCLIATACRAGSIFGKGCALWYW